MNISSFTKPELDVFRENCNFVGCELDLFEMRSRDVPLEIIAEELNLTSDGVKKTSQKVNRKIRTIIALLAHY